MKNVSNEHYICAQANVCIGRNYQIKIECNLDKTPTKTYSNTNTGTNLSGGHFGYSSESQQQIKNEQKGNVID
ncbi:unnamed protein product [Adineta ricciae]|uniref:Uncharacterized protein n=1 Tax=Adineta ricciae TaxID=249248 RepID=A0A815PFE9_ADIRI|nr:unnamed protein product [Adineta ricciae]CAF1470538.1 unnamed protein product [Adineta ricciae]